MESLSIVFRGNCVDAWVGAYIAELNLRSSYEVSLYAVADRQMNTWPEGVLQSVSKVLLIGLTDIPAISGNVSWINHMGSNIMEVSDKCISSQLFEWFHGNDSDIPEFLKVIDRFSRWDSPSVEDRCIREYLNTICHVSHQSSRAHYERARDATDVFVMDMLEGRNSGYLVRGKELLEPKERYLASVLQHGRVYHIHYGYLMDWGLPESWLGAQVYVVNNLTAIDSTEAGHMVLSNKSIDVFVNYRIVKGKYMLSARSRKISLTKGMELKGHDLSAGGTFTDRVPFVEQMRREPVWVKLHDTPSIFQREQEKKNNYYKSMMSYPPRQSYQPKIEDFPALCR
jgi:hypothetical protein